MQNDAKTFWFIKFCTKICLIQNYCVLDLMMWMDLLKFVMELDI